MGEDPDPTKDSGKVQTYVTHASYAYFGGLEKGGQDGEQHNEIKGWLKTFEVRNKNPPTHISVTILDGIGQPSSKIDTRLETVSRGNVPKSY